MSAPVPVFTEFYVQTTGSNLNAGSTNSDSASVTSTNGDWGNAVANRFTAASGTPFSGVSVGDWASVYLDAATVTGYIARVTAVNGGGTSVDLSTTAISGTAPATGATGRTCKIGGAWKGPNGTEAFPFGFLSWAATDASNHAPRCNIKGGTNYNISAAMTHAVTGANVAATIFEAYTSTVGDGGIAVIDGGSPGGSTYTMLTVSVNRITVKGIQVQNNGTGSPGGANGDGFRMTGGGCLLRNCIAVNIRRSGIFIGGNNQAVECEAANCQTSNTASGGSFGGINIGSSAARAVRCISHNHTAGSNSHGFVITAAGVLRSCISANNAGDGYRSTATGTVAISACDAYNNTGTGLNFASGPATPTVAVVENCNFYKNGGYGIIFRASTVGALLSCTFGRGTQINTSGDISVSEPCGIRESGTKYLTADTTPWSDPTTGDFRLASSEVVGAGRGRFLITKSGYGPTTGYTDIGAAQKNPP